MIKSVQIKNFKSIRKLALNFSRFNILCGENASGKTSIIHSILMASQKTKNDRTLDGGIIKIGSLRELKNSDNGEEIYIKVKSDAEKSLFLKTNKDPSINQKEVLIVDPEIDNIPFEKTLFYLSSDRMGVKDIYSKGNFLFGSNGEAVIDFFYQHQEDFMSKTYMDFFKKIMPTAKVVENPKFSEHVRFWMEYITGETIGINSIDKTNQYVLTYGKNQVRPINTGSGYSFLLPVIVVCLGAILLDENVPTVIIENPEIYLHPIAQRRMFAFFSMCKEFLQLIIETHSEHLLKDAIDKKDRNIRVFVTKLVDRETKLETLSSKFFKTHPGAYAEVIYRAFNIKTSDLHIVLFGLLHERYNQAQGEDETSLKEFDQYLKKQSGVVLKTWVHKNKKGNTTYETLSTFVRNKIDHPEAKSPTGKVYEFSEEEMNRSIDFLYSLLT